MRRVERVCGWLACVDPSITIGLVNSITKERKIRLFRPSSNNNSTTKRLLLLFLEVLEKGRRSSLVVL